ncbi:MAG: imidazole glycerol phosphate synthase subunit HisH [Silvanigrellales bacterium]|nr:imidazole glycerol phosphate synthase subunit HisH [Silvanigrellales bacterium]
MGVQIIDYGAGNLGSVVRAVEALGHTPRVVREAAEVASCERVIFPGVGHAGQAMRSLREKGLDDALRVHVRLGKPLLGICVGMQVLGLHSEEDDTPCLGLLPFCLRKFRTSEPVPHMGWNSLNPVLANPASQAAFAGLPAGVDAYFVHSYFAPLDDASRAVALATTTYGGETFVSAVAQGALWGMQFHVEKSGRAGLALIANFLKHSESALSLGGT